MPADETKNETKSSPKRKALIVAIDDYGGLAPNLPSCINDAVALSNLLTDSYGFEVQHLFNKNATLRAVRDGVGSLCRDVGQEDRVVFFYSGHGSTIPRVDKVEECLVLADGSFLPDDDFVSAFRDVPSGTALVCLDSCFSGGMSKALGAFGTGAIKGVFAVATDFQVSMKKSLRYRPFGGGARPRFGGFRPARRKSLIGSDEANDDTLNALLLSACLEGETADASLPATEGLSAFTYSLLSALASHGDAVSIAELVAEATVELRRIGSIQTPQVKEPLQPLLMADRSFPLLEVKTASKALSSQSALRAQLMTVQPSIMAASDAAHAMSAAIAKISIPYV